MLRCLDAQIKAWRLRLKPPGLDFSLELMIEVWSLKLSQARTSDRTLEAQIKNLQLKIEVWNLRLKRGPRIESWKLRLKPGNED